MNHSPWLACVVALGLQESVWSEVIFNNFGPNGEYLVNGGCTLSTSSNPIAHCEYAFTFTIGERDQAIVAAELAVAQVYGPNVLNIRLCEDNDGVPGQVMEALTVEGLMYPMAFHPRHFYPTIHVAFSGRSIGRAGGRYWLHMAADQSEGAHAAWNHNVVGDMGHYAWRNGTSGWIPHKGHERGALRIHGIPVETCLTADVDCDGLVNGVDLGFLLSHWQSAGSECRCDFNEDGTVDELDLAILLAGWTGEQTLD